MNLICKPGDPGYVMPGSKEYANHLGCSEIAAVLGFDRWGKTANDVWMKKTHRAPDTEHKRIFDRGHAMEPLMAAMMATDHGRVIKCDQVQYRHPEHPWMIYHADGMFSKWTPLVPGAKPQEGAGIWEAKAPGSHVTQQFLKEGMSEGYVVQTQMGMFVASLAMGIPVLWGTAGFLDYDNYEVVPFDMAASKSFQDDAMETLIKFWGCVESDTPPSPINPLQHERPPEISGELEIIEDAEIRQLSVDLAAIIDVVKEAKAADSFIRDQLKDALKPFGALTEVEGVMKYSYRFGKPKTKVDGAGLLVYCEHLVDTLNNWIEQKGDGEFDLVDFDRSQWVSTSYPARSLRPTPIK